jgi:hypothetical protein
MSGRTRSTVAPGRLRAHATRLIARNVCLRKSRRPCHVRRNGNPAAASPRPHIGVSAGAGATMAVDVRGPSVDDGEVCEEANIHVFSLELRDRHRSSRLIQEGFAIDKRAVRVAALEVFGEQFFETMDVRCLDGLDVIAIEPRAVSAGRNQWPCCAPRTTVSTRVRIPIAESEPPVIHYA